MAFLHKTIAIALIFIQYRRSRLHWTCKREKADRIKLMNIHEESQYPNLNGSISLDQLPWIYLGGCDIHVLWKPVGSCSRRCADLHTGRYGSPHRLFLYFWCFPLAIFTLQMFFWLVHLCPMQCLMVPIIFWHFNEVIHPLCMKSPVQSCETPATHMSCTCSHGVKLQAPYKHAAEVRN